MERRSAGIDALIKQLRKPVPGHDQFCHVYGVKMKVFGPAISRRIKIQRLFSEFSSLLYLVGSCVEKPNRIWTQKPQLGKGR